ncbi:unnamed protein product, partial [Bubo scandiacus]
MEDMAHGTASSVPHSPGLRGPGYHFAWLTQDMLPLGTPCIAQTNKADLPVTLKSSGILCRTHFIMPQPPESLVSSGHFFQLWDLRDYFHQTCLATCESILWSLINQHKILPFEAKHTNKKRETHSRDLQKVFRGHHRANDRLNGVQFTIQFWRL